VTETSPKGILLLVVAATMVLGGFWAWFHPGQFGNVDSMGMLLFLELVFVFLWRFEQLFLAAVILSFVSAATAVPFQSAFNAGRWVVLGFGAVVGLIMWMRSRFRSFTTLHLFAAFCVLSAGVSAVVSEYPGVALAKVGSLLLLFVYGSTGARLAVSGREDKFFHGLVLALEIAVYVTAFCYFVLGLRLFGNPNSLGAAMGIGVFPVLLWAWLISKKAQRTRRFFALTLCSCLLLFSLARAAIFAGACVSLVLAISLREYKLVLKGTAILLLGLSITAIVAPVFVEGIITEFTDAVLYKGHREQGVFGSRRSPWDGATTEIKDHPYFGSGFGTSPTGEDPGFVIGRFHSASELSREHGSSYLAIVEWVGLVGILPFIGLLFFVVSNVWRVCARMRETRDPSHFAIPLAMVVVAGLVHAGFEDWLFAVGSYSCVYFWAFAFILGDLVPTSLERLPVRHHVTGKWTYPWETADSRR
jgi:O-antigen ligase